MANVSKKVLTSSVTMPKKYSEKQLSERQKVLLIHFSGGALTFSKAERVN